MAERYLRLFSLSAMKYQEGAPVIIIAGALIKDAEKNAVLVQLKLKSIADKAIKAVKVSVQPLDTVGEPTGENVDHQYLDLYVARDEEFGSKEAIYLPDNTTRQFNVGVLEVAFEDNTKWKERERETADIEQPDSLGKVFSNDAELIKQYKLDFGEDATVFPTEYNGIWFCNCAAVNREDETVCHKCGKKASAVFSFDEHKLKENRDARLLDETYEKAERLIKKDEIASLEEGKSILQSIGSWKDAENRIQSIDARISELKDIQYNEALKLIDQDTNESVESARRILGSLDDWRDSKDKVQLTEKRLQEFAQQDKLARIQERKTKKRKVLIALGCVAIAIIAAVLIRKIGIPYVQYREAIKLQQEGNYEKAIEAFEALKGFGDSYNQIEESKYLAAKDMLNNGAFETAIRAFEELDNYKDCKTQIDECNYQMAIKRLEEGDYNNARKLFEGLGDYKDSAEKCAEATQKFQEERYNQACLLFEEGNPTDAKAIFELLGDYKDSEEKATECTNEEDYQKAVSLLKNGNKDLEKNRQAKEIFEKIKDYKDSANYLLQFYEVVSALDLQSKRKTTHYSYEYDEHGNLLYEYKENNLICEFTIVRDQLGRIIQSNDYVGDDLSTYTYDDYGQVVNIVSGYKGQQVSNITYELDSQGRIIKKSKFTPSTVKYSDDSLVEKEYTYDLEDQKVVVNIRETWTLGYQSVKSTYTLYYDATGKLNEIDYKYDNQDPKHYQYYYDYVWVPDRTGYEMSYHDLYFMLHY